MKNAINIDYLRNNNLIVFEGISGSRAYGTNMPNSDTDIRGVYIQPLEDILSFGYIEQVSDDTNDIVFYEIKRFLELVMVNNPNILELVNLPEDCIVYKDPIFDLVLDQKEAFISKQCKMSFAGYAIGQIKKARGYNKKINWEESEMKRKTVLDFCYVLIDGGSKPFKQWLNEWNEVNRKEGGPIHTQKEFGLANIDHAHDLYAMYHIPNELHSGIVKDENKANQVQLCSIPKGLQPVAYLSYNKDGYTSHCKKYKEYTEWLENRNEDRFKMNKEHGKNYDSKNMAHCIRLLDMGIEIANNKDIIVRRPEDHRKLLMNIRKGEMEYEDILKMAEEKIILLDKSYEKTDLPDQVDSNFINNLLLVIRKVRYRLQ